MKQTGREVKILRVPEMLAAEHGRTFLDSLTRSLDASRPRIVLDCSRLREMDRTGIYVLLCGLEEAMKRNGDVKLSAMPQDARGMLKSTGADRVFGVFETCADAVRSFQKPFDGVPAQLYGAGVSGRAMENAA